MFHVKPYILINLHLNKKRSLINKTKLVINYINNFIH